MSKVTEIIRNSCKKTCNKSSLIIFDNKNGLSETKTHLRSDDLRLVFLNGKLSYGDFDDRNLPILVSAPCFVSFKSWFDFFAVLSSHSRACSTSNAYSRRLFPLFAGLSSKS